ncbi:ATP-binding protein [Nocardioides mesophilus]|uniref:AAA family ATPase n=1 Tax=Nocardioides mesophilus TaxID=433659 RepID=A0A7G9RAP4_9ACTN|nr:AAA family ATPase [Nocardioides mesophilus]QNN52669.1 AAA family ATPase [Nocardioides mesophilus]
MAKAAPGQALATLEVLSRSQTVFRTVELPPFRVKGKAQLVHAADVGQRVGARVEERPAAPLVGRDDEVQALERAVEEARAGRGRLLEVVGGAGLGKSRLVTEVLTRREDLDVLPAPCEAYESSTPYFPFRRLLRAVFEVPPDAAPERVAELVARRVSATAPHLVPWLPLLGVPMDVPLPPTRETAELDEQFRKSRLESVVTEVLGAVLTDPTVFVIEDAHLMDDASVDLLHSLCDELGDRPLLVVVTLRERPKDLTASAGTALTTLKLEPLDPTAALALVQGMRGERPLTPQAASEIVARGGGNPMFLEALVLEAGRAGSLARLPESVEALVTSQIDRLDPADRTVVRYAAVFGTVVDETALDLLLEHHDAQVPVGAMRRLADMLERDGQGGLRFRNALIRDVAYEGLPYSRRKALHDHVGQVLEQATEAPQNQCELLSLHFFHAGRHEQAWRYSVLAGDRALAKFAHGEAIEFFARAVQSASQRRVEDRYEVARVYERLADSRWLVGLTQEAAEAYAAARGYLRGDPVRLAGIIEKESRIDQRRRKHSVALRRISTGLNRLVGVPGSPAGVARSLLARRYAHSRFSQGQIDEALRWAEIAAYEAEEAADKDAVAQAYEMLNFIYASSGREEPLPYGRLALQAYVELGNLARQGHCLNNLAMQEYTGGRWDESLTHLREASDLFHRIGDTAAEANALYNRVELLVRQGRGTDVEVPLPDVLRIARAMEDDELVALALREQARVAARAGDIREAMALLDKAGALFVELEEPGESRNTGLARAEVLLDAGLVAEAGDVLAALTGAGQPLDATVHRLLGRQHLGEGRLTEARAALQAGVVAARDQANRYEEGLLLLGLAELARHQGMPDEPPTRAARALLDPMGVLRSAGVRIDPPPR